jgi:hypothetical protein
LKQETKKTEFSKILVAIDGSETSMRGSRVCYKSLKDTESADKARRIRARISWIGSNRFDEIT